MSSFNSKILSDYIVVDLETTGLSPERDAIIEIAAVRVLNGEVADVFETLVNPRRHISSQITAITGIDDDMVVEAPSIDTAMKGFLEFAGDMPLVGHNIIRFDMCFLQNCAPVYNDCVDTLDLAEHIKHGSSGKSLSALCEYFGIVNDNAHRALSDCMATYKVYEELKSLYIQNGAYYSMAVSCSAKKYCMNIAEKCSIGTKLSYEQDANGVVRFFCEGEPVGTAAGNKVRVFEDNRGNIDNVSVCGLDKGCNGKQLMRIKVHIK